MNYYKISAVAVDPVYDNEAARGRCPLKLFEAWLYGVPFITGDVGDRKALAGNPPAIKLCKPGDSDSLAEGIVEVLCNPSLAEELIKRGRIRVMNFFWDKLTFLFIKYLKSRGMC